MSTALHAPTTLVSAPARAGEQLYWSLVVCLVVVALPVKNVAYLVPLVYLALQLYFGNAGLLRRTMLLSMAVAVVSVVSLVCDSLRVQGVNLPGVGFGLVTFLPLTIALAERFDRTIDERLFRRFVDLCAWFVIGQSLIGMLQFAATRNPDAVCGTFGLLDGLNAGVTIAQVYFTFNIFGMLLFMLPEIRRPRVATAFVLGLIVCAVAQSGHQTLFMGAALCLCASATFLRLQTIVATVAIVLCLAVAVYFVYPDTLMYAQMWFDKAILDANSPKRIVVDGALTMLSDAKNALLGVGLGQFTSRAALITSNTYLSVDLPGAFSGQSDYFASHVLDGQQIFDRQGEGSAISKPYFSALTVVAELGFVLSFGLLLAFGAALVRNLRLAQSHVKDVSQLAFAASVGVVFLLLCCLVENYFEFPQAIFLPVLLYVVGRSRVATIEQGERRARREAPRHA